MTAVELAGRMARTYYTPTDPAILEAVEAGICRHTGVQGFVCRGCGRVYSADNPHSPNCPTNFEEQAEVDAEIVAGVELEGEFELPDPEVWAGCSFDLKRAGQASQTNLAVQGSNGVWSWKLADQGPTLPEED